MGEPATPQGRSQARLKDASLFRRGFGWWPPGYDYYQTSHGLVIPADLVVS